jgi:type II secretory pathway component PulJ
MNSVLKTLRGSADKGASLAEVVVAMLLMSTVGVSVAAVVVGARPVTDELKNKAVKQAVLDRETANVRVRDYVFCTAANLTSASSLYPNLSENKKINISTEVYITGVEGPLNNTWQKCTTSLLQNSIYSVAASESTLQRVSVKLTRLKGPAVVNTVVKVAP